MGSVLGQDALLSKCPSLPGNIMQNELPPNCLEMYELLGPRYLQWPVYHLGTWRSSNIPSRLVQTNLG